MDLPGKISFLTTLDGTVTPIERMTIKNNGRVGIGTTLPSQMLTVDGNINVTTGHTIYDGMGNPYITMTSLVGYLTGESDPFWNAVSQNYYDKTQVDIKIADLIGAMTYQ